MQEHEPWMLLALTLAARGLGRTRPNPPVGAVVVLQEKLVGEGYHKRAGSAHAEVEALRRAGEKARGATLYVTLEPCSTRGRTPPCIQAIRDAGIQEVVFALRDPNPAHRGKSIRFFRKHHIKVVEGICREAAKEQIAPFEKWITKKRPFITLKLATSMDGRIADRRNTSKWISGKESRKQVQALRRASDAILIGSQTAVCDNPSLLPRPAHGRRPFRVILDTGGTLPLNLKVFSDAFVEQTVLATTSRCSDRKRKMLEARGASVLVLPTKEEKISLKGLMRDLALRGVLHVLCEGGGILAGQLVRDRLVDEYLFFMAPCFLGSERTVAALEGVSWLIGRNPCLEFRSTLSLGKDIFVRATPI